MDVIGSVKSVSGTQPETVIGIYIKADDCFMERGLVDESECFLFSVPLEDTIINSCPYCICLLYTSDAADEL